MIRNIFTATVVFAAVFAFVAIASAQTSSYMFYTNLTVGSTGADVVALQSFLESKGFLTMPAGTSKGYFGGLTKSALASFQSAKGIAPAVGFFGPVTRAAVNADAGTVVTTTPGCPAGAAFNYMTGAPCSSVPSTPVAGCTAGAMFNFLTGAPCSTTSTPSTSSAEGTLDVKQSGSPANNANIQTSMDVPVYGLNLKATISDVTVDRIDLKVAVTLSSANENPATLINAITLKDGSTTLKTWNVSSADFIKDTNNSTIYYVRLSGLGFVVPRDVTKNLIFSVNTNSGIDSDRVLVVSGYGANSLRAISGNNVTSYYDLSSLSRTHTFKKPGTSSLTVSSDGNVVDSNNYRVSSTDGISGVTIGSFNVKSETGDSLVTDVLIQVGNSMTAPSTVYLYDGSTLLDSRSVSSTASTSQLTFSNLKVNVPKDVTKTITIKVDMPSSTVSGSIASSSASTTVTYEKPNGSSATVTTTATTVNPAYFYSAAPRITFVSGTATDVRSEVTGTTTEVVGKFVFKVKPEGASMTAFAADGSDFAIATSTTGTSLTTSKVVTVTPNNSTYSENVEYTVTLDVRLANTGFAASQLAALYIKSIAWNLGTAVTQTWGLDDFKTNVVSISK